MGITIVRKPVEELFQTKAENNGWSKALHLPKAFDRIDAFIGASMAEDGKLGQQKLGEKIVWGEVVKLDTLQKRVHDRLPNAPLGLTFFIDRDAKQTDGPDVMQARQSLDPGKVPPLRTWDSFSGAAAVCKYANRDRHYITIQVNGHPAKAQPATVYSFRDVAWELLDQGVEIWSVSGQRSCDYQCQVCKSICGNCGGCPGRCAEPGHSTHQPGLAQDFHIQRHEGMSYAEAYEHCKRVFMKHGWQNFTDWNPSGSDPNHASYKCKG